MNKMSTQIICLILIASVCSRVGIITLHYSHKQPPSLPWRQLWLTLCNLIIRAREILRARVRYPGRVRNITPPTDSRNLRRIIFIFDNEWWLGPGSRRMQFSRKLVWCEAHEKFQASQEQWMRESRESQAARKPGRNDLSTPLLHIRVRNCKWGIFFLQKCERVWVS